MDGNAPKPKQVAEKYWGNLGYFRKSHYLRRLRGWCFVIFALCSIVVAATFHYWGSASIFSKGPISKNHASFADDCRACHRDAEIGSLKALLSARPSGATLRTIFEKGGNDAHLRGAESRMDEACLKCHAASGFHLSQSTGLALRVVSNDLAVVHATQCFSCHREHAGHDPMPPASRQACVSCHNDPDALRVARKSLPLKPAPVAVAAENRDLGDGVVRFLAPPKISGPLPPFSDYANGHPPFTYEQPGLRDPADLKFNHARHERADVTAMGPNQKLGCSDCHTLGPGGVYYQPVSYQRHCQQCHSLQIQPSLPNLRIPHGDPEKTRYFLASLDMSIENSIRAAGTTDPAEISARVDSETQALRRRGLTTLAEFEQRVFFEGDPKDTPGDRRMRTGSRKFLTECAKCHTVAPGATGSAPRVNPPVMAERWVQRGPFTHLPHRHMDCADCHQGVHTSRLTSDILMPAQKLCAECHRPPSAGNLPTGGDTQKYSDRSPAESGDLALEQRNTGGIKWDCQSCHTFHAPPDAHTIDRKNSPTLKKEAPAH